MNRKTLCVLVLLFFQCSVFSQNYRDKLIHETIFPLFKSIPENGKPDYEKAKAHILKLEEDYGYETDLKLRLIDFSFLHNDLSFFKEQLTILIEKYGFNVAYMKGTEPYYDAVMKGELLSWFKPVYIEKHAVWLGNNFEKQADQRLLNEIKVKDHAMTSFAVKVLEMEGVDEKLRKLIDQKLSDSYFVTISDVYKVCRKYDYFPTGKNFGLVQNDFNVAMLHNIMSKENINRTWTLFESYLKKSYLNKDLDYVQFKNYDVFSFTNFGYQKFGLITIDDVPKPLLANREEVNVVPVENSFFADKTKREMGWK